MKLRDLLPVLDPNYTQIEHYKNVDDMRPDNLYPLSRHLEEAYKYINSEVIIITAFSEPVVVVEVMG